MFVDYTVNIEHAIFKKSSQRAIIVLQRGLFNGDGVGSD